LLANFFNLNQQIIVFICCHFSENILSNDPVVKTICPKGERDAYQ